MGLLSMLVSAVRKLTNTRSLVSNLTWIYRRVRQYLPDLDEDTAFVLAAKLHMQRYVDDNRLKLLDIIVAHKLGKEGYCGVDLTQMQRHDTALAQDQRSQLVRWAMQMTFLRLRVDLRSAPVRLLTDIVIGRKAAIGREIDEVLTRAQPETVARRDYDKAIRAFRDSPQYGDEIDKIVYALRQV